MIESPHGESLDNAPAIVKAVHNLTVRDPLPDFVVRSLAALPDATRRELIETLRRDYPDATFGPLEAAQGPGPDAPSASGVELPVANAGNPAPAKRPARKSKKK